MTNVKTNIRDSNFELLRIISMFMILILHFGTHGITKQIDISTLSMFNQAMYHFLRSLSIIAVSLYVMISGYFLCKSTSFKLSKLISLFLETSFFSIAIYLVSVIGQDIDFNYSTFIKSLFSILNGEYWFVTVYFVLYALSPFLNKLINSITKKEHLNLLITLFLICNVWQFFYPNRYIGISNGYSLIYFTFLYILAIYIRKNDFIAIRINKNFYLLIYLLFGILNSVLAYSKVEFLGIQDWYVYNSPIVLIMSYCLFMYFKGLKIKSKKVNLTSNYVFGIYLIHEQSSFRPLLWSKFGIIENVIADKDNLIMARVIIYSIVIFICCWLLSLILNTVYKKLFRFVSNIFKIKASKV